MNFHEPKRFNFTKRTSKKSQFQYPPNTKEVVPHSVNSYICPKCNQFYDFQLANNIYVGRVPLLLSCKHTLCEECVLGSVLKEELECVECNTLIDIDFEVHKRVKLQDIFPVNFYVFGMVLYYRRARVLKPNFTFHPVQTNKITDDILQEGPSMNCSRTNCTRSADLKCLDCDDMFCEKCSKLIHKSEPEHDTIDLRNFTPELQQMCSIHKSNILEFACKPCDLKLCCYCVLSNHKDHDYHQLTEMNDEDVLKIKSLLKDVENSLDYLKATDKRITSYIHRSKKVLESKANAIGSDLSTEISRHFENFHAKLQTIESNLHEQLEEHKKSKKKSLTSTKEKVQQNMLFLNKLSHCAKQLLNKEDVKYDVGFVIKNLMLALKVKCHLIRQEVDNEIKIEFGTAINDIDDSYHFKRDKNSEFILINTNELPEDYNFPDNVSVDSFSSRSTSFTNDDTIDEDSMKNTISLEDNDLSTSTRKSDISTTLKQVSLLKRSSSSDNSHSIVNLTKKSKTTFSSMDSLEDQMSLSTKSLSSSCEKIPNLKPGTKERVTVTHINSPSSFYVHLTKSSNVSTELANIIGKYAMGSCGKVEPELNEIYMVKFNDGFTTRWYRGRVTDIDKIADKYTVFFIDYGNTSIVSQKWIRNIPLVLTNIPPLAIHCKLYDLYPPGSSWNKIAISLMADIVNKETFLMVVIEETEVALGVDLITFDGTTSVREALIFSNQGTPTLNSNNLVMTMKKDMGVFSKIPEIPQSKWKFTEKENVKVIITHVESLSEIYFILAESHGTFNKLKTEMNKCYMGTKKGFVFYMEIGMFVAVSFSNEDRPISNWYRGKIVQVPESRGSVVVQLIDIGPTVSVQWENVRKLSEAFYKTNSLAFRAALIDVENISDDKTTCFDKIRTFFKPYIQKETVLEMITKENGEVSPKIVLVETGDNGIKACVNGMVVAEDCAIGTGKYGYERDFREEDNQNFTFEMMKTIQSIQSNDAIHDDSQDSALECNDNALQIEVEIVSVETPSSIYVKFLDNKRKYRELYTSMQDCYNSTDFPVEKWTAKQPVAVRYQGEFLRGIIREEIDENKYLVSLKDVRKDVEVEAKDMVRLYKNFTKCPELITRCHLANIIPAGGSDKWSAMACELLEETLKGKSKIFLIKCGKIDMETRSLPVLLYYKQYFPGGALEESKTVMCSVNKILLKNGLALKTNIIKESLPSPSKLIRNNSIDKKFWDWLPPVFINDDHVLAIPSCVNNSGYIYIHDVRDELPLEDMSKRLLDYFKDSEVDNKLEDWHVGDICIAKYFLNGEWYRAKVVAINEDTVSVIMVDYGNEEDLSPIDLRKKILFENIPVFASVVYLQDLKPLNGTWNKDDLDTLHGAIVDKEIDVYFIKGHDIRNPSPVYMSYKGINVNEFLLTKCKYLENSVLTEGNGLSSFVNSDCDDECDSDSPSVVILPNDETDKENRESDKENRESDKDEELIKINQEMKMIKENLIKNEIKLNENDVKEEEIVNKSPLTQGNNEIENSNEQISFKIDDLPTESPFEIVIINLFDYDKIVFEQTDYENSNLEKFEMMEKDIQANSQSLKPLKMPVLDSPCIVKYDQDNQYYRCKIMGIRKEDVLVWFVDYGNFEYVPKSELKEIKVEWLDYPIQHHFAEIDGIELAIPDKKDAFKEFLTTYYTNVLLADVTSRNPLKVKLLDVKTRELVYQGFINDGILKSK